MQNWLTTLARAFVPVPDPEQSRSLEPFESFDQQLAAIRRAHETARPWRVASVPEALGVPAILGAVSLIADTVGTMSMEAFRRGAKLSDPDQVPRIIQRPNPFSTPRVFFRDTAFYLATRGEAWWWIAARDPIDGTPLSLYPIPPWEITVELNDRDRLRPTLRWQNAVMRNEDMRQITYMPGALGRGVGPLQIAQVAASVAVESETWAANFYSGAIPSLIGTTDLDLGEDDLKALDRQWVEKPGNLPRWLTLGMTVTESPFNPEKAQLTATREHNVGNVARMYNMPGSLIEYNMPGASLRYQNDEQIWTDFQRRCLSPHYLEPIEQEMSDLLTRSTVARFNLDQLLRSDPKTRAEYYEKVVPLGIMPVEEAQRREGFIPGAVDYAPVPAATPQATPAQLPFAGLAARSLDLAPVRCSKRHLLAELAAPPYRFTCPRCKEVVAA
jgi:HK97 family phage portal protein